MTRNLPDTTLLAIKRNLQNLTVSQVCELVKHVNIQVLGMILDILAEDQWAVACQEKSRLDLDMDQCMDLHVEELIDSWREEVYD